MAGNRLWDSYANVDSEVAALVKVTVNIFAIVIEYKCFQVIPIGKNNPTNQIFVETRFIASLAKDVLQSLIELV